MADLFYKRKVEEWLNAPRNLDIHVYCSATSKSYWDHLMAEMYARHKELSDEHGEQSDTHHRVPEGASRPDEEVLGTVWRDERPMGSHCPNGRHRTNHQD